MTDADPWEGAGLASSVSDLSEAATREQVDPFEVAVTAAAAGLDALGAAASPLGALLEAGMGWLIEHVWFLHEALDALAGDPAQVEGQARAWHAASVELGRAAADHRGLAAALAGWDGAAADAYRGTVATYTAALETGASDAARLADLVLATGAAVGTVRAVIRDMIAQFVAEILQFGLVALASAPITSGTSIAAATLIITAKAVRLAGDMAERISELLNVLATASATAARLSAALTDTAGVLRAADDRLATVRARELAEAGKHAAEAGQERREWA